MPPAANPAPPSGLAAAAFPEPRPERDGFAPRRRLEHSVTLGHDAYLPGTRGAPAIESALPPVVIQNSITVAPPRAAWGGYGYGYGYGYGTYLPAQPRVTPSSASATPPVAGDWPAAPDSGPRPMR